MQYYKVLKSQIKRKGIASTSFCNRCPAHAHEEQSTSQQIRLRRIALYCAHLNGLLFQETNLIQLY